MVSVYRIKDSDNYYYSISYNGRHFQGSTKTKDKKSAQLIAESIQTDIACEKHDLPSILPTPQELPKKFKDVWLEYSNSLQNTKDTIKVKNNIYDKHLSHYFDDKTIGNDFPILDIKIQYYINDENFISIVNNFIDSIYESAKNKNNSR